MKHFLRQYILKKTFRILLLITIFTIGQCFPRQGWKGDRTRSDAKKKSSQLVQNSYDYYEEEVFSPKANNNYNGHHLAHPVHGDSKVKIIKHNPLMDSHIPLEDHHVSEDGVEKFETKENKINVLEQQSLPNERSEEGIHNPKVQSPLTANNVQDEDNVHPEEDDPRMDLILNDVKPYQQSESEPIIDYFYVSDAGDPNQQITKHGVIINLRGLIPSNDDDEEEDDITQGRHPVQEVIAFKAFEISSSSPGVPPRPPMEYDAQTHLERSTLDTKDPSTLISSQEPRNLSRKRRQKSTPSQEEEDRLRRAFIRKRRRKRKKRPRNSPKDHQENDPSRVKPLDFAKEHKHLLRSNSPAYVIASASEVRSDWCKTVPLKQKITEPNCKSRVIVNNFCYGQCNSFFIPHTGRTGNGGAFQSCAFCKPQSSRWVTVVMQCPGQSPPTVEKRVLMVDSCKCKTEILS